jgi:GH15 family glucan-1,4-alpha-glucosidase
MVKTSTSKISFPTTSVTSWAIPLQNPIEMHGVIGDQRTAALAATDGSIDFLCWPNFDSPTIFASLLDNRQGGFWEIMPLMKEARRRQFYLPDTNILVTRFSAPEGTVEITDFMPLNTESSPPKLIRRVCVMRGKVAFRMRCVPRFDYARTPTAAVADAISEVVFRSGAMRKSPFRLRLISSQKMKVIKEFGGGCAEAEFTLHADETASFTLLDAHEPAPPPDGCKAEFEACLEYWHNWIGQMKYRGRWREMVTRSALALKLMISRRHGSIVAAVTFGLPEAPGSDRNWDYRATWVRDASFTIYALMRLGYVDEANAFMGWIEERTKDCEGSLQIMYGVDGEPMPDEETLSHLSGHGGAAPVRIGNAAHTQVQLDVYGELMDAIYLSNKYGKSISHDSWQNVIKTVEYVCEHWREPDQGIWETRGPPRHWLHSRLMCWVTLDRASRLALKRSLPAPIERWHEMRDQIHASIWQDFWDVERGHFVASKSGDSVDAAMLMMPLVRFVSATDPKWLATLDAIGRELVDDPLVYRYRRADGLKGQEGAFTACSFWYAECLARAGRMAEARLVFERMLGYANEVGLFSEEIGLSGEHLGNSPQAFTHLALISAAFYIDRELSGLPQASWRP